MQFDLQLNLLLTKQPESAIHHWLNWTGKRQLIVVYQDTGSC